MWTADFLSYRGNTAYIAAYQGSELVWERPVEDTINYFYLQNRDETEAGDVYLMNWAAEEKSWTTGYYTYVKSDKNIEQRPSLQYSFDKRKWFDWEIVDDLENNTRNTRYKPINLQPQQKVYLRGNNNGSLSYIINGVLYFSQFDATVNFAAGGDIWSILANDQWDSTKKTVGKYGLSGLFWNNLKIVDVSDLSLESIDYAGYGCFNKMFLYCDNITATPKLSKNTHLADYCYAYMFYNCDNLENIQLDSFNSESRDYCYFNMFYWCYKVTRVPALPAKYLSTGCYENMYAHTSITEIPELPATSLASRCYYQMFIRCDKLTSIPSLPATTIPAYAYGGMFSQCYNLEQVGEIKANRLMGTSACGNMFDSTKKLKEVPVFAHITASSIANTVDAFGGLMSSSMVEDIDLQKAFPNLHSLASSRMVFSDMFAYCDNIKSIKLFGADVELGEQCYENLFRECELTVVPELPAMTMKKNCYNGMFKNCKTLTTAPELPATNLAENCYYSMFYGCTSLTSAPQLPATTLAKSCYHSMFNNCQSLKTAPELPATTLTDNCYVEMFRNCSSLTQAPELPATTLAPWCYYNMFYNCTKLTTAPELPATTLANYCYYSMFYYCTSLTKAPVLIAEDVPLSGYQQMFNYCKNLNEITCYAKTFGTNATQNWVSNVASTGTFYKDFETEWTIGTSGIPSGWTVVNINEPIDDDITLPYVTFRAEEAGSTLGLSKLSTVQTLEYSTDKSTWNTLDTSTNVALSNVGDEVYVRGKLTANITSSYTRFSMTGKIAAYGNCNALWDYTNLEAALKENCGRMMFFNCTSLTKAPVLPATTMANNCYQNMFSYCSLTKAPELPATTLDYECYRNMFYNCTSLTEAPTLPATTLANYCYSGMFAGCTSLTQTPSLPAKKLASWCYSQMFSGCTSLLTAPQLPAVELANYCYHSMFSSCTSLTTAPKLQAYVLIEGSYQYMFANCTSLQNITCLAIDISASVSLYDWVLNVASTGTFYKDPSMTSWPTGTHGIPSGWTVLDYTA